MNIHRHQTNTEAPHSLHIWRTYYLYQTTDHTKRFFLLWAPTHDNSFIAMAEHKVRSLRLMNERLSWLEPRQAQILMKNYFSVHKLHCLQTQGLASWTCQLTRTVYFNCNDSCENGWRVRKQSIVLCSLRRIEFEASRQCFPSWMYIICSWHKIFGWYLNLPCQQTGRCHRVCQVRDHVKLTEWWNWAPNCRVKQ